MADGNPITLESAVGKVIQIKCIEAMMCEKCDYKPMYYICILFHVISLLLRTEF